MACESKRAFNTFICLISITVHFTNSLSYTENMNKVISYIYNLLLDIFYRLFLHTGAKQENRWTDQNKCKAEWRNSQAE